MEETQRQDESELEKSRQRSLEDSRPPAEVPGHTLLRRLGGGAYGVVWLAREDRTGRLVAVKFFPHSRGLNWSLLSREVEKLAAVDSSRNIVRLVDVGWNADPPWFVMEFMENGSLAGYLAATQFSTEESVRIITEICGALVDAHGAGVLHCDLKPDNVLLDSQLHVRLCDFGQSRLSHEQNPSLGTLYYMAPEQAGLRSMPDARWDVYAIGALLYQMLAGSPPHRSDELQKKLHSAADLQDRLDIYREAVLQAAPPSVHRRVPGVDRRLAEIVDTCLAIAPEDRFPNAQAVLEALQTRRRQRARRPLLLSGLIVPLFLTISVVPILVNAFAHNLRNAEEQLMRRALESDALSARLQAAALEDEINNRLDELKTLVASRPMQEELEKLLQEPPQRIAEQTLAFHDLPLADRPDWMQALDTAWENSQGVADERGRSKDTSWFLNSADGTQVWRRSFSERSVGRNYRYRDYFHGQGEDFSPEQIPDGLQPISAPHICIAYKSTTTGRQSVALSVPVKDSRGNVVGILSRSAHLGDLQQRLRGAMSETSAPNEEDEQVERFIALAEVRLENGVRQLRLLDHPSLTEDFLREAERNREDEELFQQLTLGEEVTERIPADRIGTLQIPELRIRNYSDPAGKLMARTGIQPEKEWIAAFAPIRKAGSTGWMVIVQEERARVLAPVRQMAAQAQRQGLLAIGVALAGLAVGWTFILRALNFPRRSNVSPAAERTAENQSEAK